MNCDHCGHDPGPYRGGVSIAGGPELVLCHRDTGPDCYRRVTVYHELIGRLKGVPAKDLPEGIKAINGIENSYTAVLEELHILKELIDSGQLSSSEPETVLATARRLGEMRESKRLAQETETARLARRRAGHTPPPSDG